MSSEALNPLNRDRLKSHIQTAFSEKFLNKLMLADIIEAHNIELTMLPEVGRGGDNRQTICISKGPTPEETVPYSIPIHNVRINALVNHKEALNQNTPAMVIESLLNGFVSAVWAFVTDLARQQGGFFWKHTLLLEGFNVSFVDATSATEPMKAVLSVNMGLLGMSEDMSKVAALLASSFCELVENVNEVNARRIKEAVEVVLNEILSKPDPDLDLIATDPDTQGWWS